MPPEYLPAPPADSATPYAAETEDLAPEPERKSKRVLRIGPLFGAGLPSVLSIGGTLKITDHFGAGANFGMIPTIRLSVYGEATLTYREYDVYARWYPLGGPVFANVGVGYAIIRGTLTRDYDLSSYQAFAPGLPASMEVTSEASVRTMVLTPQLGLLHTFEVGFSVGVDIGAQVPIKPSDVELTTNVPHGVPPEVVDAFIAPNDVVVRDTLERVGRTILPTINVRIGWLL